MSRADERFGLRMKYAEALAELSQQELEALKKLMELSDARRVLQNRIAELVLEEAGRATAR